MTISDLIHALLLLMGFLVGLGVGLKHGLLWAIPGAIIGLLVAHLIAIGLFVIRSVVEAIGWLWPRRWGRERRF